RHTGGSGSSRRPMPVSGKGRGQEPRPHDLRPDEHPPDAAGRARGDRCDMTSRLADMSSTNNQDPQPPARQQQVAYVLVADADVPRTAACVDSIKAFNLGVLVARDGEEAPGILRRFGPPVLLITDLSLPRTDGFAVIEAVRD